jgi:hypothetical protein
MSLEAQMNHLTSEIVELRSVVNALTVAIAGLTQQAAEEVEAKRQAPFIEVIKPSDPRYALNIKAFHQDSIFEPRLEVFADLQSSNNTPKNQGAIAQIIPDPAPQQTKTINKLSELSPNNGKRRHLYPKTTYSSCCGAPDRKKSKKDGRCFECR